MMNQNRQVGEMSRLVHRPIEIEQWRGQEPYVFRDGKDTHCVDVILDRWIEMGDWWNGEGARKLLRVTTSEQGIYDLECVQEAWFIYKVWD